MAETGKIFHVRCVDNTLQRDTLSLGRVYEVTRDIERDGYYELSGLGRFSRSRFEVVETNVLGLMRMTRLCVPHLVESGAGHIVNLGSVAGIWSYPSGSSYVASKFAVHGYTRALRDDLQGEPVRITNVAPGLVETDFSLVRFKGDAERADAVYSDVAMGGPLHAEDVADSIMFALTRAPHVNVDEIVLTALAQVSGGNILREG